MVVVLQLTLSISNSQGAKEFVRDRGSLTKVKIFYKDMNFSLQSPRDSNKVSISDVSIQIFEKHEG